MIDPDDDYDFEEVDEDKDEYSSPNGIDKKDYKEKLGCRIDFDVVKQCARGVLKSNPHPNLLASDILACIDYIDFLEGGNSTVADLKRETRLLYEDFKNMSIMCNDLKQIVEDRNKDIAVKSSEIEYRNKKIKDLEDELALAKACGARFKLA